MNHNVIEVQFVEGRTRNSNLIHVGDGYFYHVREVRPRRIRLRCRKVRMHCQGTGVLYIANQQLKFEQLNPHSCERDHLLVEEMSTRRELVHEAASNLTGESVRKILRDFKLKLHPELACRFTVARMHSALHDARSANYPKLPKTLMYLGVLLGLPEMRPLCKTTDQTDYLFQGVIGHQSDKTVSVVFASGRMLLKLQTAPNLHMDGTFKKRPRKPKCRQIYNIVTNQGGNVIPLVRVLMRSRSEIAYTTLFEFIRSLAPTMRPIRIHCDFERAVINTLRRLFPGCDIVGCLWHFGACVGRKATKLGLVVLASQNNLIHSYILCLSGAALLPPTLISTTVEELWTMVEASGWAHELQALFDYFRKEWFPRVQELSVFDQPERTNNCSESDNRSLANVVPQNHPNVWTLIGGFVKLEHLSRCDNLTTNRGISVHGPPRWRTIANTRFVRRLTQMLVKDEIQPLQFLLEVSKVNKGALNHGFKTERDSSDEDSD